MRITVKVREQFLPLLLVMQIFIGARTSNAVTLQLTWDATSVRDRWVASSGDTVLLFARAVSDEPIASLSFILRWAPAGALTVVGEPWVLEGSQSASDEGNASNPTSIAMALPMLLRASPGESAYLLIDSAIVNTEPKSFVSSRPAATIHAGVTSAIIALEGISPNRGTAGSSVTSTITGSFRTGTEFSLRSKQGVTIRGNTIRLEPNAADISFAFNDSTTGRFDVVAEQSGTGAASLENAFIVRRINGAPQSRTIQTHRASALFEGRPSGRVNQQANRTD